MFMTAYFTVQAFYHSPSIESLNTPKHHHTPCFTVWSRRASLTWVVALQSSALSQTQLALSAVAGRAQLRPAVGRRAGLHHLRDVFLPLLRELLFGHGERVIHAEVIDDDGHGHGYGQHAGEGTERAD